MELIKLSLSSKGLNYFDLGKLVLTIGEFDGIHQAHKKLIEKVIAKANEKNLKSAVITFFPHPAYVLGKRKDDGYITTFDQKVSILEKMNLDYLIVVEFSVELSRLVYQDFESHILDLFDIDTIICGFDFRYGFKGEGNYFTLKEKYNVEYFEKIELDDEKISSTIIREALKDGNMEKVKNYLGRNYSLKGKVVSGNQVGSKIGLATANLVFDNEFYNFLPGVYSTYVYVEGKKYLGVCNIGHNPSFNYVSDLSVEVHILDFDKVIYDQIIEIEFVHYLRGEKTFSSPEELMKQIEKDIKITKELL